LTLTCTAAAGTCLQIRCLGMVVSSCSTVQAFRR
jgi:hypothetical protein